MKLPSIKQLEQARGRGNFYTHITELHTDTETPVSLFAKLSQGVPGCMLLESISGPKERSQYSFLLLNPVERVDKLEVIEASLKHMQPANHEIDHIFAGGYVGFYPYDSVSDSEPRVQRKGHQTPVFFLHKQVLIFDHFKARIHLLENFFLEGDLEIELAEAREFADRVEAALELKSDLKRLIFEDKERKPRSNMTEAQFIEKVKMAKDAIQQGEVFQIVLSQRFESSYEEDPFTLYRALRSVNPSPYMFYVQLEDRAVVGASPESLVRMNKGQLTLNPIAGTYARGRNAEEDNVQAHALKQDHKELAEHRMLVDLGRNDLGRVCVPGSIHIDALMEIRRYSHVMHLVSEISGQIGDYSPADALRKCFPAGTLSGAPKVRAMELIAELEDDARGFYGGGFGYFDFYGNMDFAIVIRTFEVRDGVARLQTGAGIVYDSKPIKEFEETHHKAAANFRALNARPL